MRQVAVACALARRVRAGARRGRLRRRRRRHRHERRAVRSGTDGETGGEEISVGIVSDTGGLDDRGFNEFSINGFERAQTELGVDGRVYVSKSADDYLPNLTAAVDDGHDLVIAIGFLIQPSVVEVATEATGHELRRRRPVLRRRAGMRRRGSVACALPNVLGLQFPSEEAGYLAGVVAAMMTKTNTVSTVGGISIPPVNNWIAGFRQGGQGHEPGHQAPERLLAGLRRPGEVQGDRARPDRTGLRRGLPGRGAVRSRRSRRRLPGRAYGDRRRRRPVVRRGLRAHERAEAARAGRLRDDQVGAGRRPSRAGRTASSASRSSPMPSCSPRTPTTFRRTCRTRSTRRRRS